MLDAEEIEERDDIDVSGELDDEQPRPKLRLLRALPMLLVLGLLVHFLLPRLGTIEDSLQTLKSLKPWALALALLAEASSYLANGSLLQSVVCLSGEKIKLRRAVAIEIGAGTISLVAAGALGFGAAIYRWTRAAGVARESAMLASWLPSLFDSATLILFALASAIELLLVHHLSRATVIALAIVVSLLASLIATVVVLLAKSEWMTAMAAWVGRIVKRFRKGFDESVLMEAADRAARTWRSLKDGGWMRPAASSFMVLTFDILCLECAFLAAGQRIHPTMLIAGYGVPLLLGRASFLPGGIAVTEVAMAALFGALGVQPAVAVIVVLTYRLISFWLPALCGIPIAVTLYSHRRKVEKKALAANR